jgi:predicted CXXCH cytochrome family protein
MTSAKKLLLTIALAAGIMLLASGVAMAAGTIIPHGGYDTTTDACLQCHDVHEAGSDYVLLRWATVTDTCGSCHLLYGEAPLTTPYPTAAGGSWGQGTFASTTPTPGLVVAYDPGYSGDETRSVLPTSNSIGSRTSAYEVTYADKDTAPGHNLQRGSGLHDFADGVTDVSSYIPGGTGRLTAIQRAAYPNTVLTTSFAGTNGLFCASCHTPHGNFGQELLKTTTSDTVSPKLLSGKPNHSSVALRIDNWGTEGGQWCTKCHDKRSSSSVSHFNHPDTACLVCHANDTGSVNTDFPHTGANDNLLSQEPDALCIDCHKAGLLP